MNCLGHSRGASILSLYGLQLTFTALSLFLPCTLFLAGCQDSKQLMRTTTIQQDDFDVATAEMAQSLAQSAFLNDRAPDSQRYTVVINKVFNRTSDVIRSSEQWMLMSRVAASLDRSILRRERNIVFQVPPEHGALVEGSPEVQNVDRPIPTHVMSAEFRSAGRAGRNKQGYIDVQASSYLLEYKITEIKSRELVWSDKFEFKREASGLLID